MLEEAEQQPALTTHDVTPESVTLSPQGYTNQTLCVWGALFFLHRRDNFPEKATS